MRLQLTLAQLLLWSHLGAGQRPWRRLAWASRALRQVLLQQLLRLCLLACRRLCCALCLLTRGRLQRARQDPIIWGASP